jgi:hypothetical protein
MKCPKCGARVRRPFLPDADDDIVLELAFAAGCRHIITHNVTDFAGSARLGVSASSARATSPNAFSSTNEGLSRCE